MDALIERYSRPQLSLDYDAENQDDFAENPVLQPVNFSMPPIAHVSSSLLLNPASLTVIALFLAPRHD
jgi:hypothetical protein